MEVLSLCPFRAGALIWQAAPGAYSLTVVVKATFTIVPGGEATLAETQVPVTTLAEGGAEDLSPLKPRVDVLVQGVTDPDARVAVEGAILPAGGPMPPQAPSRRLLLGDEAYAWAQVVLAGGAATAGPPPEGFEFAFFQSAPRDQRIDLLRIAASIGMDRVLTPSGRIETRLPQRRPHVFRVDPKGGRVTEIALRCDTLCIDAAQKTMVLTFRGLADLKSGAEADVGKIVVAAHPEGKRIRAERIDRFLRLGESLEEDREAGLSLLEMRHDAVLIAPKSGDTMVLPELLEAPPLPIVAPAPPPKPSPIAEPLTEDTTLDLPKVAAPKVVVGREIGHRVDPLPNAPVPPPPPSTAKPATPTPAPAPKPLLKPPAPLGPRLGKPAGPSAGPPRPGPPRPGPVQPAKVAPAPAPAPTEPPPPSSPEPVDPAAGSTRSS